MAIRRHRFGGRQGNNDRAPRAQPVDQNRAPVPEQVPLLRNGSSGPDVRALQEQLEELGFSPQGIDGDFGRKTEAAVRAFQRHHGLEDDGVVGPMTRQALGHGAAPRAEAVDEDREGGGLGGFLGRLFGGGDREEEAAPDWAREESGREPAGREPAGRGRGIELENAGFTVPTTELLSTGMSEQALRTALTAFDTAWGRQQTQSTIFTLTDFTKSDDERRLWVFDVRSGEVLHHEFVAHGYGSDGAGYNNNATDFGNTSGSGKSSLGLMRAGDHRQSYGAGREGTAALEVHGLEAGINDNVHDRTVIMHAAQNSNGTYVDERGVHGASAGCWALDPKVNAQVIASIPEGSLMYNYFPDRRFLESSTYLKNRLQS